MELMTAAVFHGPHRAHTVEPVELDEPRPSEVRVRIAATSICHTDVRYVEGHTAMQAPAVLGHETAGVVEAIGQVVRSVRLGDHVVVCSSAFCGHCRECLTGNPHRCDDKPGRRAYDRPQLSLHGRPLNSSISHICGFAEKAVVDERYVVAIDAQMPLDLAALLGCAVVTGTGAVFNTARVRPGSTVAIIGAGGVGLSILQGALIAGARSVIVIDLLESKLSLARALGATHLVNASHEDPVDQVIAITGGGADYAFDAVGDPRVVSTSVACLRNGGTATMVGGLRATDEIRLGGRSLWREKRLQACTMGSNRFRLDIPVLVDLYFQGRLQLEPMVSRRGTLAEIDEMFSSVISGEAARQIVLPS